MRSVPQGPTFSGGERTTRRLDRLRSGLIGGIALASLLPLAPAARAQSAVDWSECLRAKDLRQREEACTAILGETRDPKSIVRALTGRGNAICATAARCGEAVSDFAAVVKLEPKIPGYLDNYARALRAAERYDEALAASDRAIGLAPQAAFLYVGKAKTLAAAGKGAEAVALVERAMSGAQTDAGLLEYEGKLLGDLRRFPESHAAFDRALRLQPTRASVYVRRADVELAEGQIEAAIHDLERYPSDGSDAEQVRGKLDLLRTLEARQLERPNLPPPVKVIRRAVNEASDKTMVPLANTEPSGKTNPTQPASAEALEKQRRFEQQLSDSIKALESLEAAVKKEQAGSEAALDCASPINRLRLYDLVLLRDWGQGLDRGARARLFNSYKLYAFTTLSKSDGYRACQFTADTVAGARVYDFVVRASDDRTEQTISGFAPY